MAITGTTVSISEVRTEFQAAQDGIDASKAWTPDSYTVFFRLSSLATPNILARSIAWTQEDNQVMDVVWAYITDSGGAARSVTTRIIVDDSTATRYLNDQSPGVTQATIAGSIEPYADLRPTTGTRYRLIKGVRYRLELLNNTGGTVTGPLMAAVQLRCARRGGSPQPFTMPNGFRVNGVLDVEKVNANLQALSVALRDTQDDRYVYSMAVFPLDGIVDTDTLVERQFPIRPPTGRVVAVCAVELVVTDATAGTTWTLSKAGDSTWPTISVDGGGANVEDYARNRTAIQNSNSTIDVMLTLTPSTALGNTINRGYLVVHYRCDRWAQGESELLRFTPTPITATSSTAVATLQSQLTDIQTRGTESLAVASDLRCQIFWARDLAPAGSSAWRIPAGPGTQIARVIGYVVAVGTVTARFAVAGTNLNITGAGTTALAVASTTPTFVEGDPTDPADDLTVTISHNAGAANVLLAYCFVWYR